jgi:hypothetical protein
MLRICVPQNLVLCGHITFAGSRVSQNDCTMWIMSYKYKNICTVQLKLSLKKTRERTEVTHKAVQKYIHLCT